MTGDDILNTFRLGAVWVWNRLFKWPKAVTHKPTQAGIDVWMSMGSVYHNNRREYITKGILKEADVSIDKFTCCNCPLVESCQYAFDLYNLGGDCLCEK